MYSPNCLLVPALILLQAAGATAPDAQRAQPAYPCSVAQATVPEATPKTSDVSTEETLRTLLEGNATASTYARTTSSR